MKQQIIGIAILLLIGCSNASDTLPSSASSTYWMATYEGRYYFETVVDPFSKLDSNSVQALSEDTLRALLVRAEYNLKLWQDEDKEVKTLETLHPEFSDSKTAHAYTQFVLDTVYKNQIHIYKMRSYIQEVDMQKFSKRLKLK
jgi:hypothetical protein